MILILIYALTLLIYFMSIKIIKGSYKNFNLINSAVIFTPFLIAAPIFYNRIDMVEPWQPYLLGIL